MLISPDEFGHNWAMREAMPGFALGRYWAWHGEELSCAWRSSGCAGS